MARSDGSSSTMDPLSPDNLRRMDDTVQEVFTVMLGFDITLAHGLESPDQMQAHTVDQAEPSAVVGFTGSISGHCAIALNYPASAAVASAMLGGAPAPCEIDFIRDAIGELCNMLAGGWKDRLPGLGASCHLSIPQSSCDRQDGANVRAAGMADPQCSHRSYAFGDSHMLLLTLSHDPR